MLIADLSVGFINEPYIYPEEGEFATLTIAVRGELGTELRLRLTTEDIAGEAVGTAKRWFALFS